jgi:hypothetical protein
MSTVLHCPHSLTIDAVMRAQLRVSLIRRSAQGWEALGDEQMYQALLSLLFLGCQSVPVSCCALNEFVQEYLTG